MKTTIDISAEALEEILRHAGATTKQEAILTAVFEFNRRRRLEQLAKRFGSFEGFISNDQLAKQRGEGWLATRKSLIYRSLRAHIIIVSN